MRSVADMLGEDRGFGNAGTALAALNAPSPIAGITGQVNSEPLGSLTGAPPFARMERISVVPYAALGGAGRRQPTVIAAAMRANRVVICTAPLVGFAIFVGDSGVQPGFAFQLPPGLPYDFIIPGGQVLYAVTNAPTFMPLQVQNAPLLIGDKERRG